MRTRWVVAPILGLVLAACADRDHARITGLTEVPNPSVQTAAALTLETYLWRDFMPIAPPGGRPLAAAFRVRSADGSPLPPGTSIVSASVFYQGQTWLTSPTPETSNDPAMVIGRSSGGPLWGPGVTVNVSVLVRINGQRVTLSAKNQMIHQTF